MILTTWLANIVWCAVCSFVYHICAEVHVPSCIDLLVVTIWPKFKEMFVWPACYFIFDTSINSIHIVPRHVAICCFRALGSVLLLSLSCCKFTHLSCCYYLLWCLQLHIVYAVLWKLVMWSVSWNWVTYRQHGDLINLSSFHCRKIWVTVIVLFWELQEWKIFIWLSNNNQDTKGALPRENVDNCWLSACELQINKSGLIVNVRKVKLCMFWFQRT